MKTSLSRCRQARPRAFTLIELLTVIAIIGILAAILIPVVGKVRQTARKSAATSSLREIGKGLLLYCNDNKGLLPGPSFSNSNYAGYVYSNNSNDTVGRNISRYIQPYVQTPASSNGGFQESPTFKPEAYVLTGSTAARAYQFAYQVNYNQDLSMDENPAFNPFYPNRVKFIRIINPTKSWFIKDLDQLNMPSNPVPGGVAGVAAKPFHGNVRNELFFDGHVTTVSAK